MISVWWVLAAVLIVVGGVIAFEGTPREGIGAPTPLTLAGVALMALGIGLVGWRLWVWFILAVVSRSCT